MNNSTHKTCNTCGIKKAKTEFQCYNGWFKNKCKTCELAAAKKKRQEARKPRARVLPKVRHPWELLGLECRPDWSKV